MGLKNIISLVVFIMFFGSYLVKLYLQSQKWRVNPVVLGKKQGSKTRKTLIVEQAVRISTFVWGVVWVIEIVFERNIHEYINYLMNQQTFFGLIVSLLGFIFFAVAMTSMGNSWRVGIDKENKTRLVHEGIYRYSRNPAFVGFDLMFLGTFLTFPDIITLIVMVANFAMIHLLILQEELHLKMMHGDDYLQYILQTPRYLIFR